MFTVCPKCTLTLAVTAADLRAGQGYVRCGRCSNVFNALLTLSDEPAEGTAADESAASTQSRPALQPPPVTESAADAAPESAIESESSHDDGTGTFETIVLEGDAILQTEEFVPEEAIDSEIAALNERFGILGQRHIEPAAATAAATDQTEASRAPSSEPDEPALISENAAPRRWPWVVAGIVLALLLAAQAVHHWRNQLAAQPLWNAPLTRLYAAIGVPLEPRWELGAYDVRQQGASTDPQNGNAIRVRISLANHARRAQPLPVLRLTLLDRYGKRVAARDLTPAEYLPAATSAFIGADQRIDTQVAVRDPGTDAASFEIDVCLQLPAGLRCAADADHS